jgi:phosphoribosyl-dephospho-CoA transferase
MVMTPRPHDVVRLADRMAPQGLPGWAAASLAACPWAVVRRAPHPPGLVPIGVRGPSRRQRHAAFVPAAAVTRRVTPEELGRRRPRLLPLADSLCAVAVRLAAELNDAGDGGLNHGATWGPVGAVGFELATGQQVTHADSDLDLLIRAPHRMPPALAARLVDAFAALPRTVDCQVETPCGGVSLVEWARAAGPVMARTGHGPVLVDDPWRPA